MLSFSRGHQTSRDLPNVKHRSLLATRIKAAEFILLPRGRRQDFSTRVGGAEGGGSTPASY